MNVAAGRVAVITGAGSGIGRAAALALSGKGFQVVLAGRTQSSLQQTQDLLGASESLPVVADVSDEASVDALFDAAVARFGRVDVLFNNAGAMLPPTPFESMSLEQWRSLMDVNLTGAFLAARAAYRVMKEQQPQGGRIINNGSISAHAPRPDAAGYTVSKHAITGLTRQLSLDGRRYNIACGQIDIGNAATSMVGGIAVGARQANGELLAEPTMAVADVGEAVAYMASLPLSANVQFMTVMATAMPFVGRG